MATKVVIDLEAKTDAALKEIEALKNEVVELNKQVGETNKTSKGAESGIKKIGKGLKTIGSGVGVVFLLTKAFEVFKEIGMKNQKVIDGLNIVMESLSIVFNEFFTFLSNNVGTITGFFKSLFEDPLGKIRELQQTIKQGLIDRFHQFVEVLGLAGKALGQFVTGEFSKAFDTIKDAGKNVVDVYTGVDGSFDKITTTVSNYTKKVVEAATENVKLAKTAELAAVKNQGLIEKFDKQAEQLRQVRDDESKSFAERIKANEDLALVLDEQEKQMRANAALMVKRAETELAKNKDNIELQKAYQEALNEQAGIEAQITGFRSEQQTNANSLLREQKDLQNELALIGKSEREIERIELQQDYDAKKALIEKEVTDEEQRNQLLLSLKEKYNDDLNELNKDESDNEIKWAELTSKEKLKVGMDSLNQAAQAFGEESAVGKAAAIANATIQTYESATASYKSLAGIPIVGPALGAAAAGAAIASGIANVKQITATKTPGGKSVGAPSISGAGTQATQPPAFNIVGASGTNQLAEAIGSQEQQPVKAYVVSNDVTTAQSMDRNIVDGASI